MDFGGIDFKAGPLVAAFFGAMAYAIVLKVRRPLDIAAIMLVGFAVSLFFGPLIADWIGRFGGFDSVAPESLQNAAGFVSGLGGMAICNGLIVVVRKAMNMLGTKVAEKTE